MFCTYSHHKPDGTLFYIGKGSVKRAHAKDNRNPHWKNIVAKHGGYKVEVLANWPTESEAFEHEKFLISCFRDLGFVLANITDGGDGISGYKHSAKTKAKLSAFHKVFQNTDRMKSVRIANGELSKLPERRSAHSALITQQMSNPANRERSRVGALKLASDPLFIAAHRDRALKRMQDPKFRYMMASPCVCVETGQVFKSQADAAKFVGGRSQTISRAISGARQTAYGYHWKNQE
jgi:hypothetical protein